MELSTKQANLQQIDEKMSREALDRDLATKEKVEHIEYLTGHDFFTENTVRMKQCRKPASQDSLSIASYHTTGKA